jgi:DNA-binding NarL/FixJ family response regulator
VAGATGDQVASDPIGIVLADDHALIRSGLRRVLDGEADLSVVGEAGDVEAALALTERHQPRVVVLDLNMPGTPTLPAIPRFLEAAPGSAVVVLTMEAEPGFARTALSAGARGYVLKDAAEAELVEAVRSVLAGGTYLDPSLGAGWRGWRPSPAERTRVCPTANRTWPSGRTSPGIESTGLSARAGWASSSARPTSPSAARWRSK